MKQPINKLKDRIIIGVASMVIGAICWGGGSSCRAQAPASLSPALQEVVKLSKAQVGDDVILGFIKKSAASYHLSAEDILALKDQGVSQAVISALLQAQGPPGSAPSPQTPAPQPAPSPQPQPPATAPTTPPSGVPEQPGPPPGPEVNFGYFHDQLAPFGAWIDIGGVMYWRPDQAVRANPDWRPYYDMGHWTETDNGLFWQSDYTWGDIPFHYGRWVRDPSLGWLWAPDYTWGPAWVFWRHAEVDGAIGWAPLPVGAVFVDGGFMFRGAQVGVDFDFGLGEGVFVFVGYDHFHEGFFRMRGREYAWHIHGDRFHDYYRRSVLRNEFRRDEHGRFVNGGIGHARMEQATHGRVEHAAFQERRPVGDRAALAHQPTKSAENSGAVAKSASKTAEPSKVYRPPAPTQKAAASAQKQPSKK